MTLARNSTRSLQTEKRRQRKALGAKVDILLKVENNELGSSEVGKDTVTIADDKEMDDGLVKLPKTLRDTLCMLIKKNPHQMNNLSAMYWTAHYGVEY